MLEMLTLDEVKELCDKYPKGTKFLAVTRRDCATLSRAFDNLSYPDEWTKAQRSIVGDLEDELRH